jgi:hypothetical protein
MKDNLWTNHWNRNSSADTCILLFLNVNPLNVESFAITCCFHWLKRWSQQRWQTQDVEGVERDLFLFLPNGLWARLKTKGKETDVETLEENTVDAWGSLHLQPCVSFLFFFFSFIPFVILSHLWIGKRFDQKFLKVGLELRSCDSSNYCLCRHKMLLVKAQVMHWLLKAFLLNVLSFCCWRLTESQLEMCFSSCFFLFCFSNGLVSVGPTPKEKGIVWEVRTQEAENFDEEVKSLVSAWY